MESKQGKTRAPNGASTIYFGKDGYWHGRVTVGVRDDGTPDRRHRKAKTRAEVVKRVRELEKLRDEDRVPKAGQRWTLATWLRYWLENIACPPNIAENTYAAYRVDVERHLIPGIGAHRLHRLEPEHFERLYAKMQRSGLKPATAHHVHRTIRNALNEAVRRKHLASNPVLIAKPPRVMEEEVEPYSVDEIRALLTAISEMQRNGARWIFALALGLRQGECLGIKWSDVDLDRGTIRIRRGRLRPKYKHGCDGNCGRKAGYCPQRIQTNAETGDTKSRAGKRTVGLPDPLVAILRSHKHKQDCERDAAGQLWHETGYVFAKPDGNPLNPNTDYREWKALLKDAGVRDARLHDARHTAATVLLILGVPTPTAMALMGWSSASMAARYQHQGDAIRGEVAGKIGRLLWGIAE
ncbi:MAG TPA: site-specific integrase [Streptosporangiaceae bacterium]|nr:site-specific integrase [Streptosporangiaceae bacterium]